MKKFIALAVLATSTASYASNIYDVMYLPKAGTNYGISQLDYIATGEFSGEGYDGDISGYMFDQRVGRSITDSLSLYGNLSWQNVGVDVDVDAGGDFTSTTKGLSDLDLGGRYRLMDGAHQLDLLGQLTLSTGDSEADNESNGDVEYDNKLGGHALELGAQFGQKLDGYQWALSALYQRFMEGTTDTDGTKADFDAHNGLELRADSLMTLTEVSFLRTYLEVSFVDRYEDENNQEASSSLTTYGLGAEYQYLLSQNLMVRGGLNYVTSNTASVDTNTMWNIIAGANYQF